MSLPPSTAGLPPRRHLGPCTHSLDKTAQLGTTRSANKGHSCPDHQPRLLHDAYHQYRFVFGDLLCFPLQDHERLWKFDVKNDIGFYAGNEDSVKGGSVIYMPYTHNFLISDLQLLQWYSQRRDIRRNPLPYSVVNDAVMDLLSNHETPVERTDFSQLLITPALTNQGDATTPPAPAIVQHTTPSPPVAPLTKPTSCPRTALLPIPPPAAIRRDSRVRTKIAFYKPHDIRAVTAAIREIMDRDNPPPPIFPTTDSDQLLSDIDIMPRMPSTPSSIQHTAQETRRKSRRPRHSAALQTENSSSPLSKRKFIVSFPKQGRYNHSPRQHQDMPRTPGTSVPGRSEPSSSASVRRSPTASLTSTKPALPLEEIHCVVP